MAFTSGIATNYLDLLNRLRQFVTQDMMPASERWSVVRWVPGPPAELVLQGPGLAGTDQIYVGIMSVLGADFGNWKLRGFVGWNPAQTFDSQYNSSSDYYALLMLTSMPYWIVANGRRIIMVVKTGTYYEMMHLGLFLPYATPNQYPYPLLVGGSFSSSVRWSDTNHLRNLFPKSNGSSGAYYMPTGVWTSLSQSMWPGSWAGTVRECPDGSYPLLPLILFGLGEMDGCYAVPGFGNASENIVTANGFDHLVVQNVFRTEYSQYIAIRLA